jgi:Phosphoesterase family
MRNYGFVVENKAQIAPWGGDQIDRVNDRALDKVTNRAFRGFDLNYSDINRARTFLADLAEYEKSGEMPRLMVMRLPNDHTSGVTGGRLSPLAYNADNDQAVGMIVEAISTSKFWGSTAIFILEDDAQNGPDHVDSHRSPGFVISPYVKRHQVDSHMYNTTSMLRTIEMILGLRPMTQFDASAPPMTAVFQSTPDLTPYTLEKPRTPLDARNPPGAAGQVADNMKFDREDENDDDELNDLLWRAIRKDPPPPPVHSYFGK